MAHNNVRDYISCQRFLRYMRQSSMVIGMVMNGSMEEIYGSVNRIGPAGVSSPAMSLVTRCRTSMGVSSNTLPESESGANISGLLSLIVFGLTCLILIKQILRCYLIG